MTEPSTVTVTLGEFVFQFDSMQEWINRGPRIWKKHDIDNNRGICIDAKGRLVERGEHFARAKDDEAYPIKVYRKQT